MKALLVMAHGTPRAEANADIQRVVEVIRSRSLFAFVELAFLDLNEPDIPLSLDRLVERGATEIACVPYFLHTGKHVTRDLPDVLDAAMKKHPAVTITMGDYLGRSPLLDEVLLARAAATER